MRAHQLALVPGEPMRTCWADLAMVIDRQLLGGHGASRAKRTTWREIGRKIAIKNVGPVGEHGSEISIEEVGMAHVAWQRAPEESKS